MAAQKTTINLLPQDPFEQSFLGKFLKWALSVGRYIVIGTELVVIGSFLARFSLDRQVTDLNEAIAQKLAILASYGELETEVRSIQSRLTLVHDLGDKTLGVEKQLETISGFTPVDVAYASLELSDVEVKLAGTAFSDAGFQTLLSTLRQQQDFTKIEVERAVSSGGEGSGTEFVITASYAEEEL